jgi:hypothetical protein
MAAMASSKLTGALPAISGASLTNLPSKGKNLFINGGFDVWQRGTSATHQLSYLADRWYNATSETQSRQTFTVGQTDVPHNPKYYRRGTTGSTEWYGLRQHIEDVSITAGREVTLSYWMKGSSAFTNAPFQSQNFGSGGSSAINTAITPTASITTSWARYTHTFTLASITGKTVGAGSYQKINIVRANVNNVTIDIANCQLEFGDTATDFEQRSYSEELALCQRYYWSSYDDGVAAATNTDTGRIRHITTANYQYYMFNDITFPVEMRVSPSCTMYSPAGTSGKFKADSVEQNGTVYNISSHTINPGTTSWSGAQYSLGYHIVADAEL